MCNMYWRIFSIQKLWPSRRKDILPTGSFTIYNARHKKKVSGWLPSHHGNVEYALEVSSPNANGVSKIICIKHIQISKKVGRPIIKTMTRKMSQKAAESYVNLAKKSRDSLALWTLSVVYPYYKLPMDIDNAFLKLTDNFSRICTRGDECALDNLIYDFDNAKETINRGLRQMGELPKAETWLHLKKRMAWQQKTRWDTASKEKPDLISVEKYKDKWTDLKHIDWIKKMKKNFTRENTAIIEGSPSSSAIPKNANVLVRSAEDAYKWKTRVDWGNITMFRKHFQEHTYKKMGVLPIEILQPEQEHVYIAYAHLWSVEEWERLLMYNIKSYTIIGRLDQYPRGRGQTFRDMCESGKFNIELARHVGAEAVIVDKTFDDIPDIVKKHGVVQCFGDRNLQLDTGRVQLSRPYRIRTLRPKEGARTLLYEEQYMEEAIKPVYTVGVKSFHGVRPIAAVYICSERTTSFEIHTARTLCRDALYIIGEQPSMFSFERRPPKRLTINPFA